MKSHVRSWVKRFLKIFKKYFVLLFHQNKKLKKQRTFGFILTPNCNTYRLLTLDLTDAISYAIHYISLIIIYGLNLIYKFMD